MDKHKSGLHLHFADNVDEKLLELDTMTQYGFAVDIK